MELDIWVPELSLAFEYQGEQHFRPITHWGGKGSFLQLIRRDNEKIIACDKAGITLIHINFDWDKTKKTLLEIMESQEIKIPKS